MINKQLSEAEGELSFVREAAFHFQRNPKDRTYTQEDIEPGKLFAVRWGLDEDCVLIFKLDPEFCPIVYDQVIRKEK